MRSAKGHAPCWLGHTLAFSQCLEPAAAEECRLSAVSSSSLAESGKLVALEFWFGFVCTSTALPDYRSRARFRVSAALQGLSGPEKFQLAASQNGRASRAG